jgi:hypothetical protein
MWIIECLDNASFIENWKPIGEPVPDIVRANARREIIRTAFAEAGVPSTVRTRLIDEESNLPAPGP